MRVALVFTPERAKLELYSSYISAHTSVHVVSTPVFGTLLAPLSSPGVRGLVRHGDLPWSNLFTENKLDQGR